MKPYVIGVDFGGTNVKLGLVSETGRITARGHLSTQNYRHDKEKLINALIGQIDQIRDENGLKPSEIEGIGIGLPGLIDPLEGVVRILPNVPGWKNIPLRDRIEKKLGIKTVMDNDVNLITLAEWQYGAGVGYENFLCVTLGTGVGGGLILNGALYRGEGFVAGEVGHFPYLEQTLEKYVGNGPLQAKAAKIFRQKDMPLEEVFALAEQGNEPAREFWAQAGMHIGTVLAGVINVLNPRLIVIGGGVSNNFKYMRDAIRSTVQQKAMRVQASMVKITRAKLGNDAGILGAQILVKGPQIEQ